MFLYVIGAKVYCFIYIPNFSLSFFESVFLSHKKHSFMLSGYSVSPVFGASYCISLYDQFSFFIK